MSKDTTLPSREEQVLAILFDVLDNNFSHDFLNDIANKLSKVYNTDAVDVNNCFIGYTWSVVDETDNYSILHDFIGQHS